MTEQTVIALLSAVGGVVVAGIPMIGAGFGFMWRRVAKLEATVAKHVERNRTLWWWARGIADLYYRHRKPDAPDLPPPPTEEEP